MFRFIFLTFLLLPLAASADNGDLGKDSRWFVQVNLAAMRVASDDGALYGWLRREVIDDLEDEFGEGSIDDFDAVTVFGAGDDGNGLGVVLDGRLSADMRERLIKRSAAEPMDDVEGGSAYVIGANEELAEAFDIDIDGESLLLAFGNDSSAFVTASRSLLDAFLAGDRFRSMATTDLLVIRAEPMVSGAVDTESIGEGHGNWDSRVMRNIRRAGFALADLRIQSADPARRRASEPLGAGQLKGADCAARLIVCGAEHESGRRTRTRQASPLGLARRIRRADARAPGSSLPLRAGTWGECG